MIQAKYRLIRAGRMAIHRSNKKKSFYRIQAVRDIPEHGVNKDDFGGYVTSKNSLSQEGSCWIGGAAQVIGNVKIEDNVYIGDKAVVHTALKGIAGNPSTIVISDNVRITGEATVFSQIDMSKDDEDPTDDIKLIKDDVQIYDQAYVDTCVRIDGKVKIYGKAMIERARWISDECEIYGNAKINRGCMIVSDSLIFGNAVLHENVEVYGSVVSGHAEILPGRTVDYGELDEGKLASAQDYVESLFASGESEESEESEMPEVNDINEDLHSGEKTKNESASATEITFSAYREVTENIMSYQTDIVKIIKYPVMVDRTDPYTLKMMMAMTTAKRLLGSPESEDFQKAVYSLEEAFMSAESNAQKIASSLLSEAEKKKSTKAKDLFRIAADEVSSEQDKKVAFIQGFKQLEGVIAVPEIAVDAFRMKIGLKELEV